ncbi:hypothetical protein DVR01_02395 [Limosilactobacillus fermentum]|nr:hypothetical protein DVR01_02395 [Limosilactobacillus fermentum]
MENFSTLEKWILWGTTIICAIIGLSIDGFLGFILLAVVAYFATKFAIKKHDERFPASLTPQKREAMKKEKEEKARIKAEKKGNSLLNKMVKNQKKVTGYAWTVESHLLSNRICQLPPNEQIKIPPA